MKALLNRVLNNDLCSGCGMCSSVAEDDAIKIRLTGDGYHRPVLNSQYQDKPVASEQTSFQPDTPSKAELLVEVPEHPAYRGVPVGYPDWIEASGHYGATFFEHIAFNLQLAGQAVDAATPEQALWSLVVASAAQHSMQTGREVDVGAFCEAEGIGDFYEGR